MKITTTKALVWSRPSPETPVTRLGYLLGARPSERDQWPSIMVEERVYAHPEARPKEGDPYPWLPLPMLYPNLAIRVGRSIFDPPRDKPRDWEPFVGEDRGGYIEYELRANQWSEALDRFVTIHPDYQAPHSEQRPDVTSFINSFGLLGLESSSTEHETPGVEPLRVWDYCARELRTFMTLATLARSARLKAEIEEVEGVLCVAVRASNPHPAPIWYAGRTRFTAGPPLVLPMPEEDQVKVRWRGDPWGALLSALKEPLAAWLDPLVTLDLDFGEYGADWAHRNLRVGLKPKNLLAAMWLAAAERLDVRMSDKPCPGCGERFIVDQFSLLPPSRRPRSDLTYCSDRCRKRVNRVGQGPRQKKRQEQATSSDKNMND